jgi:hypothetical protein
MRKYIVYAAVAVTAQGSAALAASTPDSVYAQLGRATHYVTRTLCYDPERGANVANRDWNYIAGGTRVRRLGQRRIDQRNYTIVVITRIPRGRRGDVAVGETCAVNPGSVRRL